MAGKTRNIGSIRIDGVSYSLSADQFRNGWTYQYSGISAVSEITSAEEQVFASSAPGYKKTVGWTDWSGGTVGPDIHYANGRYLASGEGPLTELSRKIVRPLQRRKIELLSDAGRVIDFFEFDFRDGSSGLYAVQENGTIRKITTTLNAETIATTRSTSGVGNGTVDGVLLSTRKLTEASPSWTWGISGGATRMGVLIGAKDAPVVRCYEGTTNGTLIWEEDTAEVSAGVNNNPVRFTHWTSGVYSTAATGGEYLWASTAPNFVPIVGGTAAKQAIWPLIQEQDPFVWSNWVAQISPLSLNPELESITGIAALRDMIVITASNGSAFRVQTDASGGIPSPIIDKKNGVSDADSGRTMRVWNGRLFIPTPRGLYMYIELDGQIGGTLVSVGPESIPGNNGPVRGHAVIYTGDPEWLYAAFWNGTDSYILKGRLGALQVGAAADQNREGNSRMMWHSVAPYIPNERATSIYITSVNSSTNPVLCIGTQTNPSGTQVLPSVHFVTLPKPGKTLLTDTNMLFDVSGKSVTIPDHDCFISNIFKTFMRITVTSEKVSALNYVDVYAKIDNSEWQRIGAITLSPISEISLPRNYNGYRIGIKLLFYGSDNTVSSAITSVSVDFVPHMPSSKFVDCVVFVAQDQTVVTGKNQYSGMSRINILELLKDSKSLFTVVGPEGVERQAQFDKPTGLVWTWTDQATPDAQSGITAKFRLNLYDDFVLQTAAIYEESQYTEGVFVSYYDMTG